MTAIKKVYEDRPFQGRLIGKAIDHYEAGVKSILLKSPTGSGKTCMGLKTVEQLRTDVLNDRKIKIGWCAMRTHLLKQAVLDNEALGLNVQFVPISMFDKNPPKVDILAVDECQHDAAASMVHIHKATKCKWILGLSATPFRSDKVGLCFQKQISDIGIHQLIREGFLSPYEHFTIPDFGPATVAEHFLLDPKKWGKSVVYFRTEEECREFQWRVLDGGITCDVVTGKTDRDTQLAKFANGETQVVVNMLLLTEGFDAPDLKTVFVRDSSMGPTIQMGGRVFRTFKELPLKNMVQSVNTKYPFQREAGPKNQYLWQSNDWRSIQVNDQLDAIAQRSANALLAAMDSTRVQAQVKAAGYTKDQQAGISEEDSWWRRGPRRRS